MGLFTRVVYGLTFRAELLYITATTIIHRAFVLNPIQLFLLYCSFETRNYSGTVDISGNDLGIT